MLHMDMYAVRIYSSTHFMYVHAYNRCTIKIVNAHTVDIVMLLYISSSYCIVNSDIAEIEVLHMYRYICAKYKLKPVLILICVHVIFVMGIRLHIYKNNSAHVL